MGFLEEMKNLSEDQIIKILEECVCYEEIRRQWWDEENEHLPTTEELAWMDLHEKTCGTGVHESVPIPAPPGLPKLE